MASRLSVEDVKRGCQGNSRRNDKDIYLAAR